jgi:DNA-binding NtrC family response regulator
VLVVEDDAAMRDLLVEELGEAHFRVESAAGGRAGVERVKQGGIDVVVSDLRMPDLDGFDLLRDLKASEPSPHVIVITAFGSIDTAIKAVKLGAYDYITKPFELEALSWRSTRRSPSAACAARSRACARGRPPYGLENIIGKSRRCRRSSTW